MAGTAANRTTYHLCPRCLRATPVAAAELFCPNDGTPMIRGCSDCGAPLTSPYDRYCKACGNALVPTDPTGSGRHHDTR